MVFFLIKLFFKKKLMLEKNFLIKLDMDYSKALMQNAFSTFTEIYSNRKIRFTNL